MAAAAWPLPRLCLPGGAASSCLQGREGLWSGGCSGDVAAGPGGHGLHRAGGCTKEGREGPAQPGRSSLRSSVGTSSMEMLQRKPAREKGEARPASFASFSASSSPPSPAADSGAGAGLRGAERGVPGCGEGERSRSALALSLPAGRSARSRA